MSTTAFKGNPVHTQAELPAVGSIAPDFNLVGQDLKTITKSDLAGKKVVLNIFPSVDTGICAMSVREFNQRASTLDNTVVLCVSKDLPFAFKRFCGAEGIENVLTGSQFKDQKFSEAYGVDMLDGPLAGLMSRAVVIFDESGKVRYTEQVPEITQEPNYEAALAAL